MQTVIAPRGDARAFLTHFVVVGLDDDRYAVQRFRSLANGYIVPIHADGTRPKGRRKAQPTTISVKAVARMSSLPLVSCRRAAFGASAKHRGRAGGRGRQADA